MKSVIPAGQRLWSLDQFAEIVHHDIRTMLLELRGIALARDADHKSKTTAGAGLNSGDCILDDDRPRRLNPEQLCRHQKRIWRRFPGEVLCFDHLAIDPHIEERV